MPPLLRATLPLALCLSPAAASALNILPGLWEVSSHNMQVGDQAVPGMQEMITQLQSLPPEQRQMMERLFEDQGVRLGAGGVQMCLTEAQIKAQEIPLHDPASGCHTQVLERSAARWTFRFDCPEASGEGVMQLVSPREFTTRVKGTYQGQPSSTETRARWVAADCAELKAK